MLLKIPLVLRLQPQLVVIYTLEHATVLQTLDHCLKSHGPDFSGKKLFLTFYSIGRVDYV